MKFFVKIFLSILIVVFINGYNLSTYRLKDGSQQQSILFGIWYTIRWFIDLILHPQSTIVFFPFVFITILFFILFTTGVYLILFKFIPGIYYKIFKISRKKK